MDQNKKTQVIHFLINNLGYCKRGLQGLSDKFGCTLEEIKDIKEIVKRIKISQGCTEEDYWKWFGLHKPKCSNNEECHCNESSNGSSIKEFDEFLERAGIKEDDVKSTKYWQTQKGDLRFSVVTKNDMLELPALIDVTREFLADIEPIKLPVLQSFNSSTLVVFLSDKHIGALTKADAIYENPYNAQEFFNRMSLVMNEIYKSYIQYGPFARIVVVDLGDALDGYNSQTTRGGHTLPQNMSNKEAFEVYVQTHKKFYETLFLSKCALSYEIYHVTNSNHGGEFEHFATRCLQEYIEIKYPDVVFDVMDKFINELFIDDHAYLLSHGKDSEDLKHGLPLVLDGKTEQYITNYILHHGIGTKNLHFIKGDLHQASTQWGKHFRYRNVPSIYGSSKWIMTNFGYSKPGCSFDLIEEDTIKQWELWF
jgi:hypothetical protein